MITDAQVHIWNANTPEDAWGPKAESHLPDAMPAERMLGLMDDAGIDRAVISPAGVAPNRSPACAQAAAAKYPKRFRVPGVFRRIRVPDVDLCVGDHAFVLAIG